MAKHLGRNPFEKKGSAGAENSQANGGQKDRKKPFELNAKASDWALTQIPAQSFLFALRTVLKVKNFLEK